MYTRHTHVHTSHVLGKCTPLKEQTRHWHRHKRSQLRTSPLWRTTVTGASPSPPTPILVLLLLVDPLSPPGAGTWGSCDGESSPLGKDEPGSHRTLSPLIHEDDAPGHMAAKPTRRKLSVRHNTSPAPRAPSPQEKQGGGGRRLCWLPGWRPLSPFYGHW